MNRKGYHFTIPTIPPTDYNINMEIPRSFSPHYMKLNKRKTIPLCAGDAIIFLLFFFRFKILLVMVFYIPIPIE